MSRLRIAPDLNLSAPSIKQSAYSQVELSKPFVRRHLPGDSVVTLFAGKDLGRGDVNEVEELESGYRKIAEVQLPGVPFYDDCYHAVLTCTAAVGGGATFRPIRLVTRDGCALLVVDVLALGVDPDTQGKGIGSALVNFIKHVARKEAAKACSRGVLLTQADNACLYFWEKNGFEQSVDACSLAFTLRETMDCVIFSGSTPMALPLRAGRRARDAASSKPKSGAIARKSSASSQSGAIDIAPLGSCMRPNRAIERERKHSAQSFSSSDRS